MKRIITSDKTKTHVCVTPTIAMHVEGDLLQRGCAVTVKTILEFLPEAKTDEVLRSTQFDFGGMIMTSLDRDEEVHIPAEGDLPAQTYVWWEHQTDILEQALIKALGNPRTGGYVKVHATYNCVCLPQEHASRVLEHLKSAVKPTMGRGHA